MVSWQVVQGLDFRFGSCFFGKLVLSGFCVTRLSPTHESLLQARCQTVKDFDIIV